MSEIEKEIEILENALSGALLVPSECAFVNTQVIKICLDTLRTYESWENLIRFEIEKEIRTETIEKIKTKAESLKTSPCPQGCTCENEPEGCLYVMALNDMITFLNTLGGNQ